MNDEETESNERKAVHYFQKAIELGNTNAMFRISYYLHNGKGGLQVDIPREIELLTEASKRGNHQATYRLGLLFEDNESGMAQNLELSVKYFRRHQQDGRIISFRGSNTGKPDESHILLYGSLGTGIWEGLILVGKASYRWYRTTRKRHSKGDELLP